MAGKKSGFLTDAKREYLNTPSPERQEKYTPAQKAQFDTAIGEQAKFAIDDLVLIARECEPEGLKAAFSPDSVVDLVDALMDRFGMEEVEGEERYYEVVLRAIEHRIHDKFREQGRFFKLESSDYPIMPKRPAFREVKAYTRK